MSKVSAVVAELAAVFSGRLVLPGEPGYEEARKVHNGLVDKRPAVVAQCRGMADIADAVRLGRSAGLEVAVRGGGHNVAGRSTTNGGLMIDLSLMRSVHVDPRRRTARAEGGVVWRELNRETQAHGLAVTGGAVGSTGVAGLTLGGGLGWLMARHGMTLDNLLSVDLVLADGRMVRASADEEPDLFWAVRGGGGNFGVAGSFEFRLHEVGPTVIGGLVAWPIDHAQEVLRFYREITAGATDDLMALAALLTAPDGATKLVAIAAAHFGAGKEAEAGVASIKRFGSPALDTLGPMPYVALNGMLDAAFPRGALYYWKSHFIDELSDGAIDTFVERFARCPTPQGQMLLEHFHGAATRVAPGDTAYALRRSGYNSLILGEWTEPSDTERSVAWARESYAAMQPFLGSQRYLNYLDEDDANVSALAAVYGENLPRLRQIKKQYDPDNFFRMNVNIPPA